VETVLFVSLLIAALGLAFIMLRPFLGTLFLASVLAFLFSPLHHRIARTIGSPSWSAFVVMLLVLATVMIPIALAGFQVVREAGDLYTGLRSQTDTAALVELSSVAQSWTDRVWPGAQLDPEQISSILQQGTQWLLENTGALFAEFGRLVVNFVFLLIFFYYLVRDGKHLARRLQELIPLAGTQGSRLLKTLGDAVSGTVRGSILVAVLQGLVAGIGFVIFGVPNPALWASAIVAASFIPSIGTAIVQIPAVAYLALTVGTPPAIGLGLWALLLVSMLDNVLKPKLIGSATRMHPLIAMIGVLGGIAVFGPMGLLIGPVAMAFLTALLELYRMQLRAR